MSGENGSQNLVKFWWVLALMIGAIAGAVAAVWLGITCTIWGILGIGLPLSLMMAVLERTSRPRGGRGHKVWAGSRSTVAPGPRRNIGEKRSGRRGQLHAINGRKTAEPPSSGGA